MTAPVWVTPPGFLFTLTESLSVDIPLETIGDNVQYSVICGALPSGISLSDTGVLSGFPSYVTTLTRNKFVVRAKNTEGATDRTFIIDIIDSDAPRWQTNEKYLRVGISGEEYGLNKQWVDYQFYAVPYESPRETPIQYFIADNDGKLPPGLKLDKSGRLSGFIDDNLGLNDDVDPGNGYDFRSYDTASYDYYTQTTPKTKHVPKLYQFRVTATDGIASAKKKFTIIVVDMEILENNILTLPVDITLPSIIIYLQKLQFLLDTNLGTIRASNNQIISIAAYDPEPSIGTVTYRLEDGDFPEGLQLDTKTGHLYGYVPYQPAYALTYDFAISATKTYSNKTVKTTKIFNLTVKGEIESTIEWITSSNLGEITVGQTSSIEIKARQINSDYAIKYKLTNGFLPSGLELKQDGSISGSVSYGTSGTFTFTARASDVYNLSAIEKTFNLQVVASSTEYTKIYVRPFLTKEKRKYFSDFISNTFIFPPKLIYRYFDQNFGIQNDIKFVLEFAIEKINLTDYTVALRENFYRRKLTFGKVKIAYAKNKSGEILYEIIYVDIIDNLVNNFNTSVSHVVYANNEIYYPASTDNMRKKLQEIVLDDFTYIDVQENFQPKFIKDLEKENFNTGYVRVMPICYALPGQGLKILERIKVSGFKFNLINFEIDRIIIENAADSTTAKYLLFTRDSITDAITDDDYLFGPEGFVRLDKEDDDPLIRE